MNSGIFLINKDKGLSSNKAIQKIRGRLNIKKIGPIIFPKSIVLNAV
jgi:tRNA U55 pseudouridine synthase TruB